MCGITGCVSFDCDLRREQETFDRMTETMACRGPTRRVCGRTGMPPSVTGAWR